VAGERVSARRFDLRAKAESHGSLDENWRVNERFVLKATVEIRVGCRSLNVKRLSSGRLRGATNVRGPVVENMIAVATY
jgi:hypothetical protein